MSSPELIYLAPECHEQGERLWCADDVWGSCHEHDGEHCVESHPSVRYVRGDVHDALAQRCREMEADITTLGDGLKQAVLLGAEAEQLRAEVERRERQRLVLCEDKDRLIDMCKERDDQIADLKARLLEAERGPEELVRLRAEQRNLRAFVDWVRNAPVSSGVCCCGDDMDRHGDPMACGHSPVDEWDYTLADRLVELDLVEPKP